MFKTVARYPFVAYSGDVLAFYAIGLDNHSVVGAADGLMVVVFRNGATTTALLVAGSAKSRQCQNHNEQSYFMLCHNCLSSHCLIAILDTKQSVSARVVVSIPVFHNVYACTVALNGNDMRHFVIGHRAMAVFLFRARHSRHYYCYADDDEVFIHTRTVVVDGRLDVVFRTLNGFCDSEDAQCVSICSVLWLSVYKSVLMAEKSSLHVCKDTTY